jgi:hypothetical protein
LVSADENKLKQALNAVNFLIDGIQSWWAITQFAEEMSNAKNISANWTFTELWLQRLKNNGLQMICAIWAAVAVMAAPFSGWLSLLAVAALSTAAGMAWARLWQRANEWLQNRRFKKTVLIDGVEREIKYDDPTDVEMLKNYITWEKWGKISPKDFLMNVWTEFVIWTISVYGFMKAWQILWKGISNFAANNPNAKLTLLLKKIKPQFGEITDPYTQNMFDNVAQWIKNKSFWQKFISEFSQELWEEWTEWVAW